LKKQKDPAMMDFAKSINVSTMSDSFTSSLPSPRQNHLLDALPSADLKRLAPHLELVPMPLGEYYYESGDPIQYVYFPTTSVVSLLYVTEKGCPAEIAGVGNEGMLGIAQFMDGNIAPTLAFVRMAGYGYKLPARVLIEEFNRAGSMERLLLRYTHALITQVSQTALCNRHHHVEQQLCRWLLLTLDRMQSNELILTQELVASMFGLGRKCIMEAIKGLQQEELIRYCDGHITVLDRHRLENCTCQCYRVIKAELDHLLGLDWDWRPMPESTRTWTRASTSLCAQT
jgi:CRP-like cAMP-binding protein